jgi:hypothetical protein
MGLNYDGKHQTQDISVQVFDKSHRLNVRQDRMINDRKYIETTGYLYDGA